MTFIKEQFSIKDLENLSGVKAHTIRIWEQRYNLLNPVRSETNIRTYSNEDLKKILNVSLLNANGEKISKIARLTLAEMNEKIEAYSIDNAAYFEKYSNDLLLVMMSFDVPGFNQIYATLRADHSFETVFISVFIPMLEKIGILWQTNSIEPAHEYFISNLIREKLYSAINQQKGTIEADTNTLFVVFLPLNEIHDLGALYIYYYLLLQHKHVVYLGPNISTRTLSVLKQVSRKRTYYCVHGTTQPVTEDMTDFIKQVTAILEPKDHVIFAGRKGSELAARVEKSKQFTVLKKISDLKEVIG